MEAATRPRRGGTASRRGGAMCGISGFNFRDETLIAAMNRCLAHRGPDHADVYLDANVSLGHRRLSVIDPSAASHQPMSDESGETWLTYNGAVYNFVALRAELEREGVRFRSQGDSEVLLHAYRRWGPAFLGRLNGMFALGLYDRPRGRLLLARDPLGIKPLYYSWDGHRFVFSSEIKALLAHEVPRRLHRGALAEFLTFRFTIGKQTLLENVFKLLPGHFLEFDLHAGRVVQEVSFWSEPAETEDGDDLAGLTTRFRELFLDAVRIRLVADVPLGFFLSGGLDSTAVVAAARELGATVRAYSAGFAANDERPFARIAAARFADRFQEVFVGDECLELLDDVVYHMDEPVGDPAFLAVYVLSRQASREVKVVLAGEGADELFGGYLRYKAFVYGNELARWVPSALARALPRPASSENLSRVLRVLGEKEPARRYLEVIRLFSGPEMAALRVPEASAAFAAAADGLFDSQPLRAAQRFDLRTLLPNDFLLKADKMSSAWGVEMRVPFLDPRLVDFALRLPRRAKLRGWNEKYLLKRAFAAMLPPEIVGRRKHGFSLPMDVWLRGPLRERLTRLLSERVHDAYDPRLGLELLDRFQRSSSSYRASFLDGQKLWSLMIFEIWYRKFGVSG